MPCRPFKSADGKTWGIVCGPRTKRDTCQEPGCTREHVALCDFKLANGNTCDRRMCLDHQYHIGPNQDLCGPHYRASQAGQ
jgi:hypothetical protein